MSNHLPLDGAALMPRGPAAGDVGDTAAGSWPRWAVPQLLAAVELAKRVPEGGSVAGVLYRDWFNPIVGGVDLFRPRRPLVGIYRGAHAGCAVRIASGDISIVDRHDVLGADGWWRTWGESWTPPRSRPGSVRLVLTPRPERFVEFVRTVTGSLLRSPEPWALACATTPRRLRRLAPAVLDVRSIDVLPETLLSDLAPTLRPLVPPLCLPIAPGVGVAAHPDNGMSFGEHRCHLIATAVRRRGGEPLDAIADVFRAHGIDPAAPHLAG